MNRERWNIIITSASARSGFLWRVRGVTLRGQLHSCEARNSLNLVTFRNRGVPVATIRQCNQNAPRQLTKQVLLAKHAWKWAGLWRSRWREAWFDVPTGLVEPYGTVRGCWKLRNGFEGEWMKTVPQLEAKMCFLTIISFGFCSAKQALSQHYQNLSIYCSKIRNNCHIWRYVSLSVCLLPNFSVNVFAISCNQLYWAA